MKEPDTLEEGDLVELVGPHHTRELARVANHGGAIAPGLVFDEAAEVRYQLQLRFGAPRLVLGDHVLIGTMVGGRRVWTSTKREWVRSLNLGEGAR